jgi:hypothetical protein
MLSKFIFSAFIVSLILSSQTNAQEPQQLPVSTATLPLAEILKLHQQLEQTKKPEPKPVPIGATINKIELSGRLLSEAIDFSAQFDVSVIADGDWVRLPLIRKDANIHISEIPSIQECYFVIENNQLVFITNVAGQYSFELSFIMKAKLKKIQRHLELAYFKAVLATLKVKFDKGMFRLLNKNTVQEADGYLILPRENKFIIDWQQQKLKKEQTPSAVVARQPVESIITSAHGSIVSILDGRRITRLLYQLRFEGQKEISFSIPKNSTLKKVFLNNRAIDFTIADNQLALKVSPGRAGDESARLELVLLEEQGEYYLSGQLDFVFPKASWDINNYYVKMHLPPVYNYTWAGGSLAETQDNQIVEYSSSMPTPGKQMLFQQELVSRAPSLRINYSVDLTDNYYKG